MNSLAVVLAVSNYTSGPKDLPACENDGAALVDVLQASGKYNEVLHIHEPEETLSSVARERIADFADKYRDTDVKEMFFYFTGHGHFEDDEAYYLLSDYIPKKQKQTSLQNSELDAIVRGLNPDLYVKIIDACHSGIAYIKSAENLVDQMKSAASGLKSLYFMFSSQSDEVSWAGKDLSYFTKSILSGIEAYAGKRLRYKDLMDIVADDHALLAKQSPFFVTQGGMTDVFTDMSDAVREAARRHLPVELPVPRPTLPSKRKQKSPADLIREVEQSICTREEAGKILESIVDTMKELPISQDYESLYTLHVSTSQDAPRDAKKIGDWLDSNVSENFFAIVTKKRETYQKRELKRSSLWPAHNLSRFLIGDMSENDYKLTPAIRHVVDGFKITSSQAFELLTVRLEPTTPALTPEECYIVPVMSRTTIRLFWAFGHFEYSDWDVTVPRGGLEWSSDQVALKATGDLTTLLQRIKEGFVRFVEAPLNTQWRPVLEKEASEGEQGSATTDEKEAKS